MKPFEIYISYVSWGSDSKYRPVLVFSLENDSAFVLPVTSQYKSKSEEIRIKYFKLNDWKYAGLDKQSYVDTGNYFTVPLSVLRDKDPVGELSTEDKQRLLKFLMK